MVIGDGKSITLPSFESWHGDTKDDGLDGEGETEVIRITSMAELENATRIPVGFSGAWYDPSTNGQGWFVEVLSDMPES